MNQYLNLMNKVFFSGVEKADRTGVGTRSIFGHQMRFNLEEGFPILTTKKVHFKSVVVELLWFLRGDTNIKFLKDHGVRIWDEWADENGDLGPVYGHSWRSWPNVRIEDDPVYGKVFAASKSIDQIANVINAIKTNPDSRRLIVSAWNPAEVEQAALPPCHALFQFYVANGKLSCQLYQRSADVFLGVPFNIASYALLTHMIAQVCGLGVGEFVWTGGDCHLYLNHTEQVLTQIARKPGALPKLWLNPDIKSIDDFKLDDIGLIGYEPQPAIKAEVAV